MHHEHADAVVERLRADSIAFVNTSIIEDDLATGCTTVPVAATDIATDLGNPLLAAMVMVAALTVAASRG